jgi:hypothetical protein
MRARILNTKGQGDKGAKSSIQLILLCSILLLFLCVVKAQTSISQQEVSVRWVMERSEPHRVVVEVTGLSLSELQQLRRSNWKLFEWQRLLSVHAGESSLPPMLGKYEVQSNVLRFVPRFPLEPGMTYQGVLRPDRLPGKSGSGSHSITTIFTSPPRNSTPTTVVSKIYPSAEVLPENLLKFYIHFSAPMSRGNIYDHIYLRDSSGKKIELPFLEIDEELWDKSMMRLTLFIDPGRIKRGVLPLEEIGPSLETGNSYTLVIGREWSDGAGNPLKEEFRKVFKVGPPDRIPPDPAHWKIQPPQPGTLQPLMVLFPEPMDHALSQRVIHVTAESGELIEGNVEVDDEERRWEFAPGKPWRQGAYSLVIQTTLEDLAGNNIGKPFEVDLFEGVQRKLITPTIKLAFDVR